MLASLKSMGVFLLLSVGLGFHPRSVYVKWFHCPPEMYANTQLVHTLERPIATGFIYFVQYHSCHTKTALAGAHLNSLIIF